MPRPRKKRRIRFIPNSYYFKPRGIPMAFLEEVVLTMEEGEALRLKDYKDMNQIECAKKMRLSQSTFQRILSSARKKLSNAIIEGKAIKIK